MPPDQEIRFCSVPGAGRVAYATVGSGPPLVIPALWLGHLELEWEFAEYRAFLTALARGRTVIRYDRLGTGLSDRDEPAVGAPPLGGAPLPDAAPPHARAAAAIELEVATLTAVIDALALDEVALLGISWGAATAAVFAARNPRRVSALATVGGFARGAEIAPPALCDALVATVRAHWGAGARALSDVWLPGATADLRERFAALQRASASADRAAEALAAIYATDVRDAVAAVRAPALVLHRRDDRAIPFGLGRELAATLPSARLVALDGAMHPPWLGDSAAVLGALDEFFEGAASPARVSAPPPALSAPPAPSRVSAPPPAASPPAPAAPLSRREREVLRLVADGLGDPEIAERLVVSPHTVHRHVANIRAKLRQPTRAAAVAYAARSGLI